EGAAADDDADSYGVAGACALCGTGPEACCRWDASRQPPLREIKSPQSPGGWEALRSRVQPLLAARRLRASSISIDNRLHHRVLKIITQGHNRRLNHQHPNEVLLGIHEEVRPIRATPPERPF